jgi:hypothetical protein
VNWFFNSKATDIIRQIRRKLFFIIQQIREIELTAVMECLLCPNVQHGLSDFLTAFQRIWRSR